MSSDMNGLREILSNFPQKYGDGEEESKVSIPFNMNADVANSAQIAHVRARLKEHILHSNCALSLADSLPELIALDPDLVAEREKKRRKLRKALN